MWIRQIIVAIICMLLATQQVTCVVNNGQPAKTEESKTSLPENNGSTKPSSNNDVDPVTSGTENKSNRREAPLDSYAAPLAIDGESYLPSASSNVNLPVPIYGVPDAPSNNIVYPGPPADIPPPVVVPVATYGVPVLSNTYGVPGATNILPPVANTYGPPQVKFDGLPLTPPKFLGPKPRPQYGPPKITSAKFPPKYPYKSNIGFQKHLKPSGIYGPPSGYIKDNYNPSKLNVKFNNIFTDSSVFSNSNFGGQGIGGPSVLTHTVPTDLYGGNNVGFQTNNVNLLTNNIQGISGQYGTPDVSIQILEGHVDHNDHSSVSNQYGIPHGDVLGPQRQHYGPPQPLSHPRPPHPGAPAPPTPPDIKYDGWQPIPGLVSRVPTTYGVPPHDGHPHGDTDAHKDLSPPPLDHSTSTHYGGLQSDSYGAPLNTVTGDGGVVSSSGEEVHGQHLAHSHSVDIGHGETGGKDINIDIYPSGTGSLGEFGRDSYSAPPLNSYSPAGPYGPSASHAHGSTGSIAQQSFSAHNKYNSYNSHGYKALTVANSGRGLIPPNGVYGTTPGVYHGTPLFSNSHGINSFKTNNPKTPVVHGQPVPPGVLFDSATRHGAHRHNNGFGHSVSYLPPPVHDIPKIKEYVPSLPSSLFSLPNLQPPISFQTGGHSFNSGLNSYNAPLNIVDGSYNLPQTHTNLGGEIVGLDLSHPTLTIDLTHSAHSKHSFPVPQDCRNAVPSLSYGVPSANGYTASLSSLTTNIGGAQAQSLVGLPHSYGAPDASYQVSESHSDHDLSTAHSEKVNSETKLNSIENESHGKSYGKSVAASFGSDSELLQSQSIDVNNIPVKGALGSYTLQIQSADGGQGQVSHGQVLNDGLLESILAAIEQPENGKSIIQLQKSLEQQNYVTNDSIPAVVGKLADEQIEHSSSPVHYVVEPSNEVLSNLNVKEKDEDENIPLVEDNGIALYFNHNNQRSKKETAENNIGDNKQTESNKDTVQNKH